MEEKGRKENVESNVIEYAKLLKQQSNQKNTNLVSLEQKIEVRRAAGVATPR